MQDRWNKHLIQFLHLQKNPIQLIQFSQTKITNVWVMKYQYDI